MSEKFVLRVYELKIMSLTMDADIAYYDKVLR